MSKLRIGLISLALSAVALAESKRPNIIFIFSDDHALNAISAYGGRLKDVAPTPNIDKLANDGALFEDSFCTNSICGPSRASILSGKHSHKNGFMRNTGRGFDQSQWTFIKELNKGGYQNALIGKWHLKTKPTAFHYWDILPGQGAYYNPTFDHMDGTRKRLTGYCTDVTTEKAIDWIDKKRDKDKPFFLMIGHKAPHRTFAPALRHLDAFKGVHIPEPANLFDDYATRSKRLPDNEMEVDRHLTWEYDLKVRLEEQGDADLPKFRDYGTPEYSRMNEEQKKKWDAHFGPLNKKFIADWKAGKINHKQMVQWKYQRYLRNYLATVKAVDEGVGNIVDYLDKSGLSDNTVVIYSSDQGFYIGEHGWFDKRWMFEESFKMPFIIKWPGVIKPGSRPEALIQNIDYGPTFLDMAGLKAPPEVDGKSIVPVLKGEVDKVRDTVYYSYYEFGEHAVPQQFGVRTKTHKLIHFPWSKEWNMFDLVNDPTEMKNIYDDPKHAEVRKHLRNEYKRIREELGCPSYDAHKPRPEDREGLDRRPPPKP